MPEYFQCSGIFHIFTSSTNNIAMAETRYVITALNVQGQRTLAEPRQRRYTYESKNVAEQHLIDIKINTSPETIRSCMGTDLEVRPVACYLGGDPVTCWFD